MPSVNEVGPTTIMSLANEVRDTARNICNRSGSIADCLGGSAPEIESGEKAQEPNDLHGILQRVITTLRSTQEELMRSERLIGIPSPPMPLKPALGGCKSPEQARY